MLKLTLVGVNLEEPSTDKHGMGSPIVKTKAVLKSRDRHFTQILDILSKFQSNPPVDRYPLLYYKMVNQQAATMGHDYFRSTTTQWHPVKLTVCPTNHCNLRCKLCPTGYKDPGRDVGMMAYDTFKAVMAECGPAIRHLDLYSWGEPFINPDIFKMIKLAHQYWVNVAISTNLNRLTDRVLAGIFDAELDDLIVSLDGVTQDAVSHYQVGTHVPTVFDNLQKILAKRRELGVQYPKITWRYIVNRYNEHEMDEARTLRQLLGIDRLEFGPIRCDMGKELSMTNEEQFQNVADWLPKDENLSMYDYKNRQKKILLGDDCRWLWTQATINWDGSVSPCCAVWHAKDDYGRVNDHAFLDLWNNDKFKSARKSVMSGGQSNTTGVCNTCVKNDAQIF